MYTRWCKRMWRDGVRDTKSLQRETNDIVELGTPKGFVFNDYYYYTVVRCCHIILPPPPPKRFVSNVRV